MRMDGLAIVSPRICLSKYALTSFRCLALLKKKSTVINYFLIEGNHIYFADRKFFGRTMYLSVSGQLYAEMCAAACSKVLFSKVKCFIPS